MVTITKHFPSIYRDSVTLMQHSATIMRQPGVAQASLVMATAANLELLADAGLLSERIAVRPNDILLAIEAEESAVDGAVAEAERLLADTGPAGVASDGPVAIPAVSLEMALTAMPEANLALISCPGEYAAAEAEKALRLGLDTMIFSDNVALEDEVRLKTLAAANGRLVMGPDCGTAIVDGVVLGFANVVARGNIGIAAASGTGLQQVACLVDQGGAGISHALGTGGRDLSEAVGGASMLRAIELLGADDDTGPIVLISKPPSPAVAARVAAAAAATDKPVIVNFLGGEPVGGANNLYHAATLAEAAQIAVALSRGEDPRAAETPAPAPQTDTEWRSGQRFLRGLYSGGTFCYEAQIILRETLGGVRSSTPLDAGLALADPWTSHEHTVIDLGDDLFTRGRPHPMIDHRLRNERLLQEAADPDTAVILFDIVLGYGSHDDPAGAIAPALHEARQKVQADGRDIAFVGFTCGTEADPQGLSRQQAALREAGVLVARHNAEAVRWAAEIVRRAP